MARSVSPKEQLSLSLVQFLSLHYNKADASLDDIRVLFTLSVGYAGFMRIDEIISVRVKDIQFHSDHMTIFVPKRKNDQHRNSHSVDVAMSGKISCPVLLAKKLIT